MDASKTPIVKFSPEIQEYLEATGWRRIQAAAILNCMIFIKDEKSIVFINDLIDFKQLAPGAGKDSMQILFNWESLKQYHGFDGVNMFHVMWLLDFMGAVSLKEIDKALRSKMHVEFMVKELNDMYPETNITKMKTFENAYR